MASIFCVNYRTGEGSTWVTTVTLVINFMNTNARVTTCSNWWRGVMTGGGTIIVVPFLKISSADGDYRTGDGSVFELRGSRLHI